MKAIYITEHGGVDTLMYGDLPEPTIGPNDVRVRVRACALNRLDVYTREGSRGTRLRLTDPHILGGDVAGEVVESGTEVTRAKIGDRVVVNPRLTCGQCRYCVGGQEEQCVRPGMLGSTTDGGYAEYVKVPAANLVAIPDSISYEEAASLPTVFMPCWSIMMRRASLKPWESVLVPSASSGVGTAAVQVAKNVIGATVIATTSTQEKAEKARELGADEVINYVDEDIVERIREITGRRGVDMVLDHVGADLWPKAMKSLAPGGRYCICGATSGYQAEIQLGLLFLRNQTIIGGFMGRKEDLQQIVAMVARNAIHGVIHQTFPLEDAALAHQMMESRNFFGKLVLVVP